MEQSSEVQDNNNPLSSFLQSLKKSSKHLQNKSTFITHNPQPAIEALFELHREHETIFSSNPKLSKLSELLFTLRTLLQKHKGSPGNSLKSLIHRQIINYRIYQVAFAIEAEVQACIDQENVQNLVKISQDQETVSEEERLRVLKEFENRLLLGFDSNFQELVLRAKGFTILESLLCDSTCSKRIREQAALCIVGLVEFNRDVFVGLVLMGPIVQSLISMASGCSIQVLCSLIRLIKTPLIDEIELDGEIPRIISLLRSQDLSIQVAAMDCICEIAYSGRKEVIEAMIEEGLIEKLMEFQRSKFGDNLVKKATDQCTEKRNGEMCEEDIEEEEEEEIVRNRPFASCVKTFAVQVEVGDGLNYQERKALKMEILRRVKEASVSEAEEASIVAEVLWGSSS
ncbi:conserved hypothetical protein [Ricinus communis]|uniref:Uncharacterized protein n=1 Tax=Ricinus communis TaxID=3988 RepID=B9RP14_RICCO|nr:conserved hypothetical protein [Ricinus communis]|eukprot:XP_002515483.1 uncharacterized protein LOC8259421 [Ricinus communis]